MILRMEHHTDHIETIMRKVFREEGGLLEKRILDKVSEMVGALAVETSKEFARVYQRFDELESKLEERFEWFNKRLLDHDHRISALEDRAP